MLTWVDALVAQLPKDWSCELEPKDERDKVLEVPAELLTMYRAGMWSTERAYQINDEHTTAHQDAEDNFK